MLRRHIFLVPVLLSITILLVNAVYAFFWLRDQEERSIEGPFRHFAVTPKEIEMANARMRVEIANRKTGGELEEYFSSAGFDCRRTLQSELGADERESWTKRRPASSSSIGCRYEYSFFGVWGAVFALDEHDRLIDNVKVFNGSRLN